jgi:hypothetical protein
MKKLSKSKIEDLVWSLWEGYDHDMNEFPEWGSYIDEKDQEPNREKVVEFVVKTIPVTPEDVKSVLQSIEHMRECVVYDEREVGVEVKDWTGELFDAQGKKGTTKGYELLKSTIDEVVKTFPEDSSKRERKSYTDEQFKNEVVPQLNRVRDWEKEKYDVLIKMGIPKRECNCLLHYGRISKFNDEHKETRTETYESLLKKNSKHVKV